MSAGTMFSVALTLAVVLGVMGVALKLLRRYTMGAPSSTKGLPMEVVQRLTIGQRQGIAVVRIGSRVLAVSMGDGGVHPIAELNPADLPDATTQATAKTMTPDVLNLRAMTSSLVKPLRETKSATPATKRVSYVAPLEDFQAVLNMALREPVPARA
jgi:flagellar biogenesis protein FliO